MSPPRTTVATEDSVGAPTAPVLARPPRRHKLPRRLAFVRALQKNLISVWPEEAYSRDVTHVRLGKSHIFTANTPDLAKHVLLDNAANYRKSPIARRLFEPALGQGLLTIDGDLSKKHRKLMAPIFAARRMTVLVPAMVEETDQFIKDWHNKKNEVFDLTNALSALTLNIITRTMFGAEAHADTSTIAEDVAAYQKILRPSLFDFLGLPDWIPRPGMRGAKIIAGRLTDAIYRVIARRREAGKNCDDLLELLLEAVDHQDFSLREIRDEIATVFTAGHETTAASLAWTLYLLDCHPDVEHRLSKELHDVLNGRLPVAADLENLRFTRMVIEESMRLYPPAHTLTRQAIGDDKLGDEFVPAGSVIMISPWLLHRNPTLWNDPERFDPNRFDPNRHEAERSRYAYIPFGAGPRICIGASFAMTETILVLATILQSWKIRLIKDQQIEPLALITMRPRLGIKATAEPR